MSEIRLIVTGFNKKNCHDILVQSKNFSLDDSWYSDEEDLRLNNTLRTNIELNFIGRCLIGKRM